MNQVIRAESESRQPTPVRLGSGVKLNQVIRTESESRQPTPVRLGSGVLRFQRSDVSEPKSEFHTTRMHPVIKRLSTDATLTPMGGAACSWNQGCHQPVSEAIDRSCTLCFAGNVVIHSVVKGLQTAEVQKICAVPH